MCPGCVQPLVVKVTQAEGRLDVGENAWVIIHKNHQIKDQRRNSKITSDQSFCKQQRGILESNRAESRLILGVIALVYQHHFSVLIKADFISTTCNQVLFCELTVDSWSQVAEEEVGMCLQTHSMFKGRAFWITPLHFWGCAFRGKKKKNKKNHTCEVKVLQEVRVKLSVRGQVLRAWSMWGHKCLGDDDVH